MKFINNVSLTASLLSLIPFISAAATPDNISSPQGSFKIGFNVRRGSSKENLSPADDQKPRFVKRADGDGSFNLELINEQTFYLAELHIGSNKDKNQVLVDTGSSDLWVMSHDLKCVSASSSSSSGSSSKKKKRDPKNVFGYGTGTGVKFPFEEDQEEPKQSREDHVEEEQKRETPSKSENVGEDANKRADSYYTTIYLSELPDGTNFPAPGGGGIGSGSSSSGGSGSGSNTCTSYGSFNTGNSDTFKRNDTDSFQIQYADGTYAKGIWGYDTVRMGNISVPDLSFAIANETSSDIGVLGIGLPGLETTTSYGYMYENLPIKMKSDGIIKRVLFSLYLDQADADSGSLLFGAIDHAKYEGSLETIPMLKTYRQIDYPVRFEVEVSNITLNNNQGVTANVMTDSVGAVLDSGSTLSYLYSEQIQAVGEALQGRYSSSAGAYIVDCRFLETNSTLDIQFSGKTIKVPVSDLVLQASRSTCYLGLFEQSSSSSYILFGDNVLRSAYIVYDLEEYEVHIGQVYYTDDEDIEVVDGSVTTGGGQNSTRVGGGSGSSSSSSSSNKNGALSAFNLSWSFVLVGLLVSMGSTL
ncbi:Sap9 secreted aspartyl proteinase [Candida orthopsilosis Co 90-125]|uniref:candidapepsin n=1 Tax=Candida orthopsilosis (strain 90-125) TaxID=1136231 RepID=H8X154_CANO9|nr:Sap9 secreted aspartyl proteinase [Candida orthopsilosis Co 90-125]CCG22094.1 Sap9 secreted aspartyl proteinase [Candida orthopsilosis Co 90-125]